MIILLSGRNDGVVNYLEQQLLAQGELYFRIDVEGLCLETNITWTVGNDTTLLINGNTSNVSGVFARYAIPLTPDLLTSIPANFREYAIREASDALLGALMLQNPIWMNAPEARYRSTMKVTQLRLAQGVGFNIPDTIVSSSKGDLIKFWKAHGGNVVTKAIYVGLVSETGTPSEKLVVFTSKVSAENLRKVQQTNFPPVLLQEKVAKVADIRVVVVNDICYASRITSEMLDWRQDKAAIEAATTYELEQAIAKKCVAIVNKLGLKFGVLDLAVDNEGKTFFLEVNQQGNWLWMEKDLGLPIRSRIIECLKHK